MTGLIYLVIIALWAAVLIPMWLRRHDQISEVRSTARFSSAMRSLASDTRTLRNRQANSPQAIAARRRALVLAVLAGLTTVALLAAVMGSVPMWVPLLSVIPLAGFVAATVMTSSLRQHAPRSTTRTRETVRETSRESSRERSEEVFVRSTRATSTRATSTRVVVEDDFEAWDPWEEDVAWDVTARAELRDPNAWDAMPTTLPTYVSAPRATAVPREIDRASGGDWSGDAMVQAARRMRRPRITSEDLTDERYGVNWKVEDAATAELPAVNVRVVNE